MSYTNAESREQLLEDLATTIEELDLALACVGEAHELLDDYSAEKLEAEFFKPLQTAYARAQRTYTGFAARHGAATRAFEQGSPGAPSQGARGFLDGAVAAVGRADLGLGEIQDSTLSIEAGDPELRAGLAAVREGIGGLAERSRELLRGLGR